MKKTMFILLSVLLISCLFVSCKPSPDTPASSTIGEILNTVNFPQDMSSGWTNTSDTDMKCYMSDGKIYFDKNGNTRLYYELNDTVVAEGNNYVRHGYPTILTFVMKRNVLDKIILEQHDTYDGEYSKPAN